MDKIGIIPKSHQYGFSSQFFFKKSYNGDTTSLWSRDRALAEGLFHSFFSSSVAIIVYSHRIGRSSAQGGYFYSNPLWSYLSKVFCEESFYFFWFLIWY